ncbi:glycosyltransferase family 4 protein [Ornithinimicrobium sp. F0845]|uniref:glycosyltransferase family 4 protein n=1 Tax=Ornithinimicrobium sp. F0845 TaxID=2926412 RepID=UPI001FF102D8|nr:glycosyltransferase family 4 protein [Ornithinimicrobium sp. F0845]
MAAPVKAQLPTPPPVDGPVLSTTRPQRIVALADDAADFTRVADYLRGLTLVGHVVALVWRTGEPDESLDFLALRRRIRPGLVRSSGALRQLLSTPRGHWRGDRDELVDAVRLDPAVLRWLDRADGVVAFGDKARADLDTIIEGRSDRITHTELRGWAGLGRTWTDFQQAAQAGELTSAYAEPLARRAALLKGPAPDSVQADLTDYVTELTRSGHHQQAVLLLPFVQSEVEDDVELARRRALLAYTRTSENGLEDPDLRASATSLLAAIDEVLAAGDLERTAALTTVALGLLFHVELHADKESTPLVEDPDGYLRDWRASDVGRVLARSGPGRPRGAADADPDAGGTADHDHDHDDEQQRVVVLRGSYPQFSAQLVEELRARADTEVVVHEWPGRGATVKGLGVRPEPVEARLRQAMGEDIVDEELTALFDQADAVFIDWADRGALVALMHVPDGVRVTLRIHSMDALSPWIHLIDWSRVDHLVFVSDHLRDVVRGLLGDRLSGTTLHVLPNAVDTARIPDDKTPGHLRRLIMIGWAQPVKDPAWALEVLARLRAHDPGWTLVLVGPDFAPGTVTSGREYAARFRERLAAPDVRGGVEFVGATRDLAPHLRSAGFVLSSSRRESFGLGLVEGAASGAVPVVRNWPIFARLDGARGLFPSEWVVDTVEAAVERVLANADEQEWARSSATARDEVERRFLAGDPARALSQLVLGGSAEGPTGS